MNDLVKRLLKEEDSDFATHPVGLLKEAADRIEKLEAELLEWKSRAIGATWLLPDNLTCGEVQNYRNKARKALEGKDD